MHIPDGYLSPQTYIPLWGTFVVFLSIALKKLKKILTIRNIPYLSMASAFTFLIMMFNIPIPGGTSGHVTGAAIISIILGPWAAMVSISVALIIQSLIFSDGGITAIGANCFNMAVVMPFVSYYTFKLIKGKQYSDRRIFLAAFIAGYIGINISAIVAAFLFGIQPLIASTPEGQPLYAPYGLEIALPAMMLEHLLLIGFIEGFVTAFLLKYFIKNEPDQIYSLKHSKNDE
jgi:cobalt/nickel transport system permease protein